ncbi:MAG: enolase C-terminal domain-like protein [Gammaproteobacteria bacterium]|jgi:muconate cycloisomerase
MKITRFDIVTVDIPMRQSVRHALAERSVARNILVAAHDADGNVGWGECCPRPYVTGETIDSVKQDLGSIILPQLLGRELESFGQVRSLIEPLLDSMARNQQAAFCAAELALLDLAGRHFGVSAGSVLGPVQAPQVRYSGVIATDDIESVKQNAAFMAKFGVNDVKVKVGASLESNLGILTTARAILGEAVTLRIDANCAWSAQETLRQLEAMQAFSLTGVEQPVPGEDIAGMREVTAAGLVPVVADESLCSLEDARTLVRERACDVFNVRISKCGGLVNAGRIDRLAREAGLACQLGAQVGEAGILSAAGRHYATRSAGVRWCEGSYGKLLLEEDITDPDVTVGPGGMAPALEGEGIGVTPVAALLQRHEQERQSLSA